MVFLRSGMDEAGYDGAGRTDWSAGLTLPGAWAILNAVLTIDGSQSSDHRPAAAGRARRARLIAEVLEELTAARAGDGRAEVHKWIRRTVSLTHLQVLGVLECEDAQSVGAIARALDVSLASATGIVGRMEERGLVVRGRDPHDRRIVLVELTDAGRAVRGEIEARAREGLLRRLGALDDDDLGHLLIGIRALRAARRRLAEEDAMNGACEPLMREGTR
jgi:DNA-binding MarR family transcriptional regulator